MATEILPRSFGSSRDSVGLHRVLRWVAVAELNAGVLRAEVGSIVAASAATAGGDENVAWKRRVGGLESFRGHGPDLRVVACRVLPAARHHHVSAFAVIVL